jgi:hypothetical protein
MRAKNLKLIVISFLLMLFIIPGTAVSSGLFGPPQPVSREEGGLNTAIGYGYHVDKFEHDSDSYTIRQNQVYSQVAYGARHIWEVYGRIGMADLEIDDAYRPTAASITSSRDDFEENEKFFGALGAKAFYPFNSAFGIGAFIQGYYSFDNFTDEISGIQNGTLYRTELKVKELWDVRTGFGLQAKTHCGVVFYIGPYVYYSEAKISPSRKIPGLGLASENATMKNKTEVGGYAGMQVPLGKGFSLNVEGQYSERFSIAAAITYTYQNRER